MYEESKFSKIALSENKLRVSIKKLSLRNQLDEIFASQNFIPKNGKKASFLSRTRLYTLTLKCVPIYQNFSPSSHANILRTKHITSGNPRNGHPTTQKQILTQTRLPRNIRFRLITVHSTFRAWVIIETDMNSTTSLIPQTSIILNWDC